MNILFCINKDIFSNIAINYLSEIFKSHKCYITLSHGVGKPSPALEALSFIEKTLPYEILFPLYKNLPTNNLQESLARIDELIESTDLDKLSDINRLTKNTQAAPTKIEELVEDKNPDKFSDAGRLTKKRFLDFDNFITKYSIRSLTIDNINNDESRETLKSLNLDLIISIRYGQIFKDDTLTIPKYGILNLHSGKLPQYRGIMATFWSMLNHEETLGTTLHYIDDNNIDTGKIIKISYINFNKTQSLFWHLDQLYIKGCKTIIKAAKEIENGTPPKAKTPENMGNYYSVPQAKDISLFKEYGYSLYKNSDITMLLKKFHPDTETLLA